MCGAGKVQPCYDAGNIFWLQAAWQAAVLLFQRRAIRQNPRGGGMPNDRDQWLVGSDCTRRLPLHGIKPLGRYVEYLSPYFCPGGFNTATAFSHCAGGV